MPKKEKMEFKLLVAVLSAFISLLLLSFSAYGIDGISQEECESGNGEWVIPVVDIEEGETRQPYCKCPQGFRWQNSQCEPIPQQILCEASDGSWNNIECICPEGSEWTENIGCDQRYEAYDAHEKESSYPYYIKIAAVLLFAALIIYWFRKKAKKRK